MVYHRIVEEHKRLTDKIDKLKRQIAKYPSGKFFCSRDRQNFKWFLVDSHTKSYIPKSERSLAEKLAIKKYLSCLLEDAEHEKRALEFYMKHHRAQNRKLEQILDENNGYMDLLGAYFKPLAKSQEEWMLTDYKRNERYPEHLIHKTLSGVVVRSKSEAMIASYLSNHKIPFRYEEELCIGDVAVYPDFTILHPQTNKIYYWEHFGMMDDEKYRKRVISKLQLYMANGIVPSENLIMTFESKEKPLDYVAIEAMIKEYFL